MRRWAEGLENQRKENGPRISASPDTGTPDFAWTRDHAGGLENPYLQQQDEEEDEDQLPAGTPSQFPGQGQPMGMPRNSSSSSLRQRSATGDSTASLAGMARAAPPRFPIPAPPTPLNTLTQNTGAQSPGVRGGDSYFSPGDNSPASSRTSTASNMFPPYPVSKAGTPQPVWDEHTRYTAPAMPRAPSRDGTSPGPHAMNGRNPRGPSLPAMATQNSAAQQQRSRSYSTPDINGPGGPRQRAPSQNNNVPAVPGIPQHLHHAHENGIPRSQTGSPRNDLPIPIRSQTQSPGAQRERGHQHSHSGSLGGQMGQFPAQPLYQRGNTPNPHQSGNYMRTTSPAINATAFTSPPMSHPPDNSDLPLPSQLKVRVNCDNGNYVTLVVAFNITYQSLIDRIDAKLARFSSSSIGKGMLKLRYRDEDGDLITIESDDDIQIAFSDWREGMKNMYSGGVGEIDLYCVEDTSG